MTSQHKKTNSKGDFSIKNQVKDFWYTKNIYFLRKNKVKTADFKSDMKKE